MALKCTSCGTPIRLEPGPRPETVECPRCHKVFRLGRRPTARQQEPQAPPPAGELDDVADVEIEHPSPPRVSVPLSNAGGFSAPRPGKALFKAGLVAVVCLVGLVAICNTPTSSPNAAVIEHLLRELNNPDPYIRDAAGAELKTYKDEAMPYLRDFVHDKSNAYNARGTAYRLILNAAYPPGATPSEVARKILEEEPDKLDEW